MNSLQIKSLKLALALISTLATSAYADSSPKNPEMQRPAVVSGFCSNIGPFIQAVASRLSHSDYLILENAEKVGCSVHQEIDFSSPPPRSVFHSLLNWEIEFLGNDSPLTPEEKMTYATLVTLADRDVAI